MLNLYPMSIGAVLSIEASVILAQHEQAGHARVSR